jgi:hypothetical protein
MDKKSCGLKPGMSFDLRDDSRNWEFIPQSAALVALNLNSYTNSTRQEPEKILYISKTLDPRALIKEHNFKHAERHLQ